MALFRKFFFKKPPDGVLLITDNIYGNGLLFLARICRS
jgi:hypothetical protein